MTINELEHKLLQVFNKVQLKIAWNRNKMKYNTSYSKGLKIEEILIKIFYNNP